MCLLCTVSPSFLLCSVSSRMLQGAEAREEDDVGLYSEQGLLSAAADMKALEDAVAVREKGWPDLGRL